MRTSLRLRQYLAPLLFTIVGIVIGSAWTYLQFQASTFVEGSASNPRAPSARAPLVPHQEVPQSPVAVETIIGEEQSEGDARPLEGAMDWDSVAPQGEVSTVAAASGVIPIAPLRPYNAAASTYSKTAAEIIDEMRRSQSNSYDSVKRPFRFHVYNIPDKYVDGALRLLEERWATSFCNRHKVKTNYTMLDWRHAFSLFTADVFITKYLRYHPSHTNNPNEADVFIIPMMTHVYHCAGVNHYTIEVLSWLVQFHHYKLFNQHDHYLFWWRWGMHYNSVNRFWKRVVKYIPHVNMISFDYLELMGRNVYQDFSLSLKPRFLEAQHHIVMPYPDFSPELAVAVPLSDIHRERKIFFYFAGTSTIGGIRRWIKRNCNAAADPALCYYEDFAKNVIDSSRLGIPRGYPAAMKNSLFCGHAAGDALSSRRPTSAILANCIPVLICDLCLYAFENLVDYNSFAVFVSEDDVIAGKLIEKLKAIPMNRIKAMQANLQKVRRHFVYNTTSAPQKGDALDSLVVELSIRGSILRQYRRWFVTNEQLSFDLRDYPLEPPARKKYLLNKEEEKDFNNLA